MKFITGVVFIFNLILWILGVIVAFILGEGEVLIGVAGIVALITFLIAWRISGDVAVSAADYFFQPDWDTFKTKLKWANSIGISTGVTTAIILLATIGNM